MRRDIRGLLDRIGERAGWKAGEIRAKMFLHLLVGVYTVARELGHGSTAMVDKVYSHLGTMRQRSEVVEYPSRRGYGEASGGAECDPERTRPKDSPAAQVGRSCLSGCG